MIPFKEAYQKAVKENGCNAGETFAWSMFRAGADNLMSQDVKLRIKKCYQVMDYMKQKSIEAHWKCCPSLSKDNDLMCKHQTDCDRKCLYMTAFVNQLLEYENKTCEEDSETGNSL